MNLIRLVHWNAAEAEERAERLVAAGYSVDHVPLTPASMKELKRNPPAALVIDLSRQPSQGRDLALAVRTWKATRRVPLVFVGGERDKVSRTKRLLPDAVFTSWSRIRGALKGAIARPPAHPVVPRSLLQGYSGTPLPGKLGIKSGSVVALVNAPPKFEESLGDLPVGVRFRRDARGGRNMTIWFASSAKELRNRIEKMASATGEGSLWIAWPKKASGVATDLTQAEVRRVGLASGLVDFKICAIDATWSGLRFSRRKPRR